jgi:hypothetical protein
MPRGEERRGEKGNRGRGAEIQSEERGERRERGPDNVVLHDTHTRG